MRSCLKACVSAVGCQVSETLTLARIWAQLLQMAMGSGFKAVTAVWRARRNVRTNHAAWRPREGGFAKAAPGTFSKCAPTTLATYEKLPGCCAGAGVFRWAASLPSYDVGPVQLCWY